MISLQEELQKKWWHRLFVVIFFILIILFSTVYFLFGGISIPENTFNVDIKYNLQEFTKTSSQDVANTIPAFNILNYKIGCLQDNKEIKYVSDYDLEKSICSPDLKGNIEEVAELILANNFYITFSKEQVVSLINEKLNESTKARYCLIYKDIDCTSDKIIAYERNIVYYLESFLTFCASLGLFILILRVIYFKAFIYIIYGKRTGVN